MAKILHLTTVHPRDDIRVFTKMALSLSDHGHEVFLAVADGKGNDRVDGVTILDLGGHSSRRARFTKSREAYKTVRKVDPEFVHFHDPELLPLGIALSVKGYRVIYDAHEDISATIRTKRWLPFGTRHVSAALAGGIENIGCRMFHRSIGATPTIAGKLNNGALVQNFPILAEFRRPDLAKRQNIFAYVGGVTPERGFHQMTDAIGLLNANGYDADLHLAGPFRPADLQDFEADAFDSKIVRRGTLPRHDVAELLATSLAGLVLFLPHPNHINAQPNKMFEYMSAGLPVLASNYPLWREIIEGNNCGICVDPERPFQIADAMQWIMDHPDEAEAMGRRGREAVEKRYNWERELPSLLDIYQV